MRNEITVNSDTYIDKQISSGSVFMVQSLDGDELQYDTLNATLDLGGSVPTLFMPKDADGMLTSEDLLFGVRPMIRILVNDPSLYKYGTEVLYRHNGVLVGKYYMERMTRVGRTQYQISCVSPVGLLANSLHYGGIYSGIRFYDLLEEIIGGIVLFSVAPELENQPVYGWLPVSTRRDNLHQALFAMGAAAQKDENGDLIFKPLSDEIHTEIPDSRIYVSGSVKYPEAVTKVSISEHTFSENDTNETVTLFEGLVDSDRITAPSGVVLQGALILFNDPMHSLVIDNGEILESGVNYAVLAPAAECKLTGKKYTHTVRQITRPEAPLTKSNDTENNITVTDATLISIANGENVADRLMSYYSAAKTITTDIVVDAERAGSAVQFTDPFGDLTKGVIKSMDINMSNTLKAHTEIIADYSPEGAGNFYDELDVISENGTWTVPSGVSKIRVAVIGGGDGGSSGAKGGDGGDGQTSMSGSLAWGKWGDGGQGGAKGQGGLGGRILVLSLNVEEGQTFDVLIGSGGAGGVCSGVENTPGTEGSDTTFGEYSSANGTRSATGYADLFGSTAYGLPGLDGLADGTDGIGGGAGNEGQPEGDTITIDGITYVCGNRGKSASAAHNDEQGYVEYIVSGGGGNGGGAAAGANGFDGADGEAYADGTSAAAIGGDGGNGAAATIHGEDGAEFGSGGQGGCGGGGGGGGGSGLTYYVGGSGGKGGMGSNGGAGAHGCVLIYY